MPSVLHQLSAGRQITSMRIALECSKTATSIRQGPAVEAGTGPAWLAHLCPAHTEDLPGWPGAATVGADSRLHCGVVLDYRPTEQVLQSHADLWLTPLTGVVPQALKHFWYDVLDQSNRVVLTRLEKDGGGEDGPLQSLSMMLGMAVQNVSEGNLFQALVPLAYCETVSQKLLPRTGLAPH